MLTEERSTGEQGGPVLRTVELTLEAAVAVLNEFKHGGIDNWSLRQYTSNPRSITVIGPNDRDDWFDPFEAIAIAEKYLAGDNPEDVWASILGERPTPRSPSA